MNNVGNPINIIMDSLTSVIYKASTLGKAIDIDDDHGPLKNAKIVVPLKYLSNFFRSIEMPLINCRSILQLNWDEYCVMYRDDAYDDGDANNSETIFKIRSSKLCVPIVYLSTEDNVRLKKQPNEGFKRSVF